MRIENLRPKRAGELDVSLAYEAAALIIGEERFALLEQEDPKVIRHGLSTGEIMRQTLEDNGQSPRTCGIGAVMGVFHDVGKFRDDINAVTDSSEVLTPEQRNWVNQEHTAEGYRRLEALAIELQEPEAKEVVMLAASGALNHHYDELPANYPRAGQHSAFAWGLTHLLQLSDRIDALVYDDRPYVSGREGELTPELVKGLVFRDCSDVPVIKGVRIDIVAMAERFVHPQAPRFNRY